MSELIHNHDAANKQVVECWSALKMLRLEQNEKIIKKAIFHILE